MSSSINGIHLKSFYRMAGVVQAEEQKTKMTMTVLALFFFAL